MGNYYDDNFEPWVRGIQGLGTMIMQGPALRAQAVEREQRGRLMDAQISGQTVAADRGRAQIAELLEKGRLVKAIEEATPQAQADMLAGQTDTPAIRQVLGSTAALTGQKSGDIATNFRRFQAMLLARSGQVDQAAGVENPVSVANTAANNKTKLSIADAANKSREKIAMDTPLVLPNQSTAVDKRTGRPVTQGAFTLGPGQQRYGAKSLADAIEPSGPVATVPPLPQSPKSSALEQERTRFIARLEANTDLTPDDRRTALAEFDRKTGYAGPPPNHPPVMGARAKMDANSMGAQPSTPAGPAGSAPAVGTSPSAGAGGKVLTLADAKKFLLETGGDKAKARELARQRGYVWE